MGLPSAKWDTFAYANKAREKQRLAAAVSRDETEAKTLAERDVRREQKRKNSAWSAKAVAKESRELRKEKRKKKRDWERKQREQGEQGSAGGYPVIGADACALDDDEDGIDGETGHSVGSDSEGDMDTDWAELKREKKAVKLEKRVKAAKKNIKRKDLNVVTTFDDL